ncbi:MAG TPA: c-type cytochrome [Phenylobacterium sp.]|jgi:cytochrome c
MTAVPSRKALIAAAAVLAAAATAAFAQPPAPAQTPAPLPTAPTAPAPAATPAAPPAEFAICGACHESKAGAGPSLGPNLFGVGGRKAGSVADYDYSPAMKASTIVWGADTLQAFVTDPNKTVPGNKMDYPGADPATAKTIADYLMTLK